MVPGGTDSPPHLPPWGNTDFLINELNTDTPGAAEDGEYIELWHPSGRRVSLQDIWILLFSAHNNKPYREISLSGHFTTSKGYFLLGSDRLVPAPSLRLPPNTIQNGPDAVALYRSPFGPPSAAQRGIPTKGLLDAVVYRQRGSDREAQELSKALTPGQLPLLEDPEVLPGDEALSRCRGLYPYDLSAFSVSINISDNKALSQDWVVYYLFCFVTDIFEVNKGLRLVSSRVGGSTNPSEGKQLPSPSSCP